MLTFVDKVVEGFFNVLMGRKGQIVTLVTERPLKVRKNQEQITKRSTFQCRVGVVYDNIQAVKDKRADGTLPAENAGLPWGEWVEFPYVIAHKGEYYLRCTMLRNAHRVAPTYTRGGVEITREEAQIAALASEFREGDDNDVFNVKVSSIREVR
jgi:hypothetical protein